MAKRMVLVEERTYDKLWKRTPTDISKSHLYGNLQSQLDTDEVPDDVKAKQYHQTLNRFLNLKQQVPESQYIPLNGAVQETPLIAASSSPPPAQKPKKPNRKKTVKRLLGPLKATKRKHIPWSRYDE